MKGKPLEIENPNGLTVKELIKFLKTANPDSTVILTSGSYRVARSASLDVTGIADTRKPIVTFD